MHRTSVFAAAAEPFSVVDQHVWTCGHERGSTLAGSPTSTRTAWAPISIARSSIWLRERAISVTRYPFPPVTERWPRQFRVLQ